jgi:hypothetical protein
VGPSIWTVPNLRDSVVDLYTFPAKSLREIQTAHAAGRWGIQASAKMIASLTARSKTIPVGAHGLFYCATSKSLTTPFTFTTVPDPDTTITDLWPDERPFGFTFEPLGSPQREMGLTQALRLLDVSTQSESTNTSNIFHLAPTQMFAAIQITDTDWATILRNLG